MAFAARRGKLIRICSVNEQEWWNYVYKDIRGYKTCSFHLEIENNNSITQAMITQSWRPAPPSTRKTPHRHHCPLQTLACKIARYRHASCRPCQKVGLIRLVSSHFLCAGMTGQSGEGFDLLNRPLSSAPISVDNPAKSSV